MSTETEKKWNQLFQISRQTTTLDSVSRLLHWDQETFMPEQAIEFRSEQIALLASLIHKERTGRKFTNALSSCIDLKTNKVISNALPENKVSALHLWRKDFLQAKALPNSFVKKFAKLTTDASVIWRTARKENNYKHFAPTLEKIVNMCRKKADLLGYNEHPYDALLDLYEPDITTKEVSQLFTRLQEVIVPLLQRIVKAPQVDSSFLAGDVSKEVQMEMGKQLLTAMGYDFAKGRLDLSTHPFCCGFHPTDCRVTSRIQPECVISNLTACLHEGGHSLYEMGLPVEYYGSPLGESVSLGLHESQSRWWETHIGGSKPFWKHFLPILQKSFGGTLSKVDLDVFYKGINKVIPSMIRVEADEVTYSLHVILRFEIERDLIEGTLKVKDIPEAWNAKMQQYLGIVPKNNSEGCLQDVHWSMGGFGYFPSYTLGNLYAAHLFTGFEKNNPDWAKRVEQGELLFIKEWLNEHVHKYGRQYSSRELLKRATGTEFSEKPFTDYLERKYGDIYKV